MCRSPQTVGALEYTKACNSLAPWRLLERACQWLVPQLLPTWYTAVHSDFDWPVGVDTSLCYSYSMTADVLYTDLEIANKV
jgi:hypothetical protein